MLSIKPHAHALRNLGLMAKVGDVTESARCTPWLVTIDEHAKQFDAPRMPVILTGSLARERAAKQPIAVILPGNAPSSRGRQHPSHAKGSKLGVSNGKPAVSYKPVELLALWHSMLNHARIDGILEYAQYHYPHLRKLITKEVIDEYDAFRGDRPFQRTTCAPSCQATRRCVKQLTDLSQLTDL